MPNRRPKLRSTTFGRVIGDTNGLGPDHARLFVRIRGTVQGVGFRPFVHGLAGKLGLSGFVRNVNGQVEIEVRGRQSATVEFVRRVRSDAPPLARVENVEIRKIEPGLEPGRGLGLDSAESPGFEIRESISSSSDGPRWFPPDIATCSDCLREVFDPADRRHRYPFTNCTNCGPRATIIDDLPYDRTRTVMRSFPLCEQCRREYEDPSDRRFHAEPIACPACGPRLAFRSGNELSPTRTAEAALVAAVDVLRTGRILALKGLGGYQLACDATSPEAVARLRERKHRWAKPLAVMTATPADAERLSVISDRDLELLISPARPIVLLPTRAGSPLAPAVSAGNRRVGVFLPYTPLHHLLLRDFGGPVVLTSGNRSDEPIAIDDDDARSRLGGIADAFLTHNREIRARYDDSVTRVVAGRPALIRRARGYAPAPIPLPLPTTEPLLAVGAQLKHTFALAQGDRAWIGPHTGDLEDAATHEAFVWNLAHLKRLQAIEPQLVAHDLHPGYLSTQWAERHFPNDRRIPVQHHHAHVAACMAEHGLPGPVIGISYDGLGLGDDGTMWGGEILLADLLGYRRVARFAHAPMPGGAAAVRKPYRMACGFLFGAERFGNGSPGIGLDPTVVDQFLARLDRAEIGVIRTQVARGLNSPLTSSVGRLFDAVAALLGLCDVATFEAEAAIELENIADVDESGELPVDLQEVDDLLVVNPQRTIAELLAGLADGTRPASLAARFHNTIVAATVEACARIRRAHEVEIVCLSGGVLQNQLIAVRLPSALAAEGFEVYLGEEVPVNDGGISFGQAAVAAARLRAR